MAEKAVLEETLLQKEVQEERLVEELEDLKVKLHQMQGLTVELDSLRAKHQELSEEHAILLRQKEHLSAGLGEREKGEQSLAVNHEIMHLIYIKRDLFSELDLMECLCSDVSSLRRPLAQFRS